VTVPPLVLNALKLWTLACAKGDRDLAFPNPSGKIESHGNIFGRGLVSAQGDARVIDGSGKTKYAGLHALRHFVASWCINRKVDGGLQLPLKVVQTRMGHSTIQMTADTYGHLFPA
jgi:integrase